MGFTLVLRVQFERKAIIDLVLAADFFLKEPRQGAANSISPQNCAIQLVGVQHCACAWRAARHLQLPSSSSSFIKAITSVMSRPGACGPGKGPTAAWSSKGTDSH